MHANPRLAAVPMTVPSVGPECFAAEGNNILGQAACVAGDTADRRFRAMFGVSTGVCATMWEFLKYAVPDLSQPRHLLWALLFLKVYASEHVNTSLTLVDEKTFRKWVWIFVEAMADVNLISWNSRLFGRETERFKSSVDGVDFPIDEPTPFDPGWFSHKLKGASLRYEVAVGIENANVVWAHGPFPCGRFPDLKIYKLALKQMLLPEEKVVADGGYVDETTSIDVLNYAKGDWGYVRARHEAINKRIKQFMVMSRRFRHHVDRHSHCFYAVLNLTYLLIESGEPIFS